MGPGKLEDVSLQPPRTLARFTVELQNTQKPPIELLKRRPGFIKGFGLNSDFVKFHSSGIYLFLLSWISLGFLNFASDFGFVNAVIR